MNAMVDKLKKLFLLKAKFALTSLVATLADLSLYMLQVQVYGLPKVSSHYVSASVGMIINFFLQKRFVFKLERNALITFLMAVAISIGGIFLGGLIIKWLSQWPFFAEHQAITKIVQIGIIFFYNFYLKRFSFEKRFLKMD
ncbi:MAG: GtrA family protein [Phaeodactylibacter sp.]|nr:GtrA family protein [Phaeodactylibacter sp.]